MGMLGFGTRRAALRRRGTASSPGGSTAGMSATAFPLAPDIHYHPHSQAAALDGNSRVLSCPDLRGLAGASGIAFGGGTVGPVEMTDALGRKFWRFTGGQYLLIANTLAALSARGVTVMGIWRKHNHKGQVVNFFSPRYSAYTDDSTNSNYTGGSTLRTVGSGNTAARLYGAGVDSFSDGTNGYKMIPGCQLHLAGVASRTTANGGQRFYVNLDTASANQSGVTSANCTGGVIGGLPQSGNGVNASTGYFDLYEFALWKGELSNAQADAAAAAMVANHAITPITRQLVLEGDSITDGIATSLSVSPTSGDNLGMQLSAPGAALLPGDVRVINAGTSGNQVADLVTRRDTGNSMFTAIYPGGAANNVVAVQIGRNDLSGSLGQRNSAMHYANVVALINTGGTGYLQRGWKVVAVGNIGTAATPVTVNVLPGEDTLQKRIEGFRALIADTANHLPNPTFLTDCQTGTGQAYDGLLDVLHLYDVTVGGDTKLNSNADVLDTASGYYDTDQTHLRVAGITLMITGGDTPHRGYGSIL